MTSGSDESESVEVESEEVEGGGCEGGGWEREVVRGCFARGAALEVLLVVNLLNITDANINGFIGHECTCMTVYIMSTDLLLLDVASLLLLTGGEE